MGIWDTVRQRAAVMQEQAAKQQRLRQAQQQAFKQAYVQEREKVRKEQAADSIKRAIALGRKKARQPRPTRTLADDLLGV